MAINNRYDFKTTFHKNPQLTTTYHQKAPIAQYVRRIDALIAVRFCAICSIYIMPKALGDILTVTILIGGCVFYSPSLCVPPFCHFAAVQCGYILAAKWRHTQGKFGWGDGRKKMLRRYTFKDRLPSVTRIMTHVSSSDFISAVQCRRVSMKHYGVI